MDELLQTLIRKHILSVNTINVQHLDSLDFHDVHISCIVDLVKEAIKVGTDIGIEYATNSKKL